MCQTIAAHGFATVCSDSRPECHAPSAYRRNDYSNSNGARGQAIDRILAFWQAQGIAEYRSGGAGGGGRWYAADIVNAPDTVTNKSQWLPLARQGEEYRADRIVFSHTRAASNGGAFCACGILPESGATNEARGNDDMRETDLSDLAAYTLDSWRDYWTRTHARAASLKRLGALVRA